MILTKPIGVGISTTAIKRELLTSDETKRVTQVMTTLNKSAAEVMNQYNVHACTDITGFGLLGHLTEMATESHQAITIKKSDVPVLPRVRELAEQGVIPGGSRNNLKHVQNVVHFEEYHDEIDQLILADAVTSGGLLMAVNESDTPSLLEALQLKGIDAKLIGEVSTGDAGHIYVK